MKNNRGRFELKMRGGSTGKAAPAPKRFSGDKLVNRSIVCVIILILVTVLKISGGEFSGKVTEKIAYLIGEQTDFTQLAEKTAEKVTRAVAEWTGKDTPVSAEPAEMLTSPLTGGTLSYTFGATEHPVFKTEVAPTGIGIAGAAQSFVYAGKDSAVSSVTENADGTLRVVLDCGSGLSLAYDGLGMTYFEEGNSVAEKQIIGMLPNTAEPVLVFEVWQDGVACDPLDYIIF